MSIKQVAAKHGFAVARVGLEKGALRCTNVGEFKRAFIEIYPDWMPDIEEFNEELAIKEIYDDEAAADIDYGSWFQLGQQYRNGTLLMLGTNTEKHTYIISTRSADEFWRKAYELYKEDPRFSKMIDGE